LKKKNSWLKKYEKKLDQLIASGMRWLTYRPEYWLFEVQDAGQYSTKSMQKIFRRAVTKFGVNPFATVPTLRHSFATHLLELRPRRARTRERI